MGRDGGMDLGRAFSYLFQDPQWVRKALIALVMLVIPIVGWLILYGYMLRIMRQTALGVDVPLPEWDDFGGDFVRGFKGYVIQFIWYLPVLIVGFCIQFAFGLLGAAAGRGTEAETIRTLLTVCANCLSFILGLMFAFIAPVFITRFAVTDRFAAAFALSEIFNETGRSVVNLTDCPHRLNFARHFGSVWCPPLRCGNPRDTSLCLVCAGAPVWPGTTSFGSWWGECGSPITRDANCMIRLPRRDRIGRRAISCQCARRIVSLGATTRPPRRVSLQDTTKRVAGWPNWDALSMA